MNIATAIARGTVDTNRPLRALAYTAARNAYLTEEEKRKKYCQLTEGQLRDFLGARPSAEEDPIEAVERRMEETRRGDALRATLLRLLEAGSLGEDDLAALQGRYVRERSAPEVASSLGIGADAVRQRCCRSCLLIRKALIAQGLEQATG